MNVKTIIKIKALPRIHRLSTKSRVSILIHKILRPTAANLSPAELLVHDTPQAVTAALTQQCFSEYVSKPLTVHVISPGGDRQRKHTVRLLSAFFFADVAFVIFDYNFTHGPSFSPSMSQVSYMICI